MAGVPRGISPASGEAASEYPEDTRLRAADPVGSPRYRAFVGPPETFDTSGAAQFSLLTFLGLRQHHYLLDVGCGSLRGGRLFIPYLLPGRYFGIEPEQWLIDEGIAHEVGEDLVAIKRPRFSNTPDFNLGLFGRRFDFILAQSVFSHAPISQVRTCLGQASKVMEPGGFFAATFVMADEDYHGDEWVYPRCVTYSLDTMMRLAREQGLACKLIEWPHPAQQTWLVYARAGFESSIPEPVGAARMLLMDNDLRFAKERLRKIEQHPYVKLGLRVVSHPTYTRLRSTMSRLLKAA